jgi:hypothetical protein
MEVMTMPDLKLAQIPDRTPVKMVIHILPELAEALGAYADAYEAAYGRRESAANLVPFMLASFLESDRGFHRSRQK